jgi:hypothetical protein
MGWTRALRWRARREQGAALPREIRERSPITVELARPRCAAGEPVVALVGGAPLPASIALVRIERRPSAETVVLIDDQHLHEPSGMVELALPTGALPTATGTRCALGYAVQVRARGVVAQAGLEVVADARPHVARGSRGRDPLIAGWEARHFHLELGEAVLRGGGRITGRVHRDGRWDATAIVVGVGCDECWRAAGPPARGMPYWSARTLWAAQQQLDVDPDRTWAPFSFPVPPHLPPAIEARTIAWRYELRANARRQHRLAETAALTPLLYDEPEPDGP